VTAALAREIIFRSGEHLVLVASSVALALLIALPLGLAIQAHPRWRRLVLGLANAVQTIPSLAIFGLLLTLPLLGGIGSTPAVVALTLYALLPLLRGLLTGLQQVPPGLKQAGQALGLSGGQVLRYVELPLALPNTERKAIRQKVPAGHCQRRQKCQRNVESTPWWSQEHPLRNPDAEQASSHCSRVGDGKPRCGCGAVRREFRKSPSGGDLEGRGGG